MTWQLAAQNDMVPIGAAAAPPQMRYRRPTVARRWRTPCWFRALPARRAVFAEAHAAAVLGQLPQRLGPVLALITKSTKPLWSSSETGV